MDGIWFIYWFLFLKTENQSDYITTSNNYWKWASEMQ